MPLTDSLVSLLGAFVLGNAAILTNVCLLPLYPGMVAYLLGTTPGQAADGSTPFMTDRGRAALMGACVLAGVLTMMTGVAVVLSLLKASLAGLLPFLLPLVYLSVVILGLMLVSGRNPLARLPAIGGDLPRRPFLAAFTYGLLLGPMTLPCTGPIVLSAFVLGLGSPGFMLEGLAYFAAFGLGFGWPLVLIPVLAATANRRFGAWVGRRHAVATRLSGCVLVAIGLFGFVYEVAPNVL